MLYSNFTLHLNYDIFVHKWEKKLDDDDEFEQYKQQNQPKQHPHIPIQPKGSFGNLKSTGSELEFKKLPTFRTPHYKGVLHIIHGISDHGLRYYQFAKFMVNNNYIVYLHDQRGHGVTGTLKNELGHIESDSKKDCLNILVEDSHFINKYLRSQHPSLPVVILGFNLGCHIGQLLLNKYPKDYSNFIFLSPICEKVSTLSSYLLKIEKLRIGRKGKSLLVDKFNVSHYNKPFRPNKTSKDYLSRDENAVNEVLSDPLCGDEDPVSRFGQSPRKLMSQYLSIGVKDVNFRLYPGSRHDILHETNKEEVYNDILIYLNIVLSITFTNAQLSVISVTPSFQGYSGTVGQIRLSKTGNTVVAQVSPLKIANPAGNPIILGPSYIVSPVYFPSGYEPLIESTAYGFLTLKPPTGPSTVVPVMGILTGGGWTPGVLQISTLNGERFPFNIDPGYTLTVREITFAWVLP
eukprot:gene523-660_t